MLGSQGRRAISNALLVLNVMRQGNAVGAPTSWLAEPSRSSRRLNKNERLCYRFCEVDLHVQHNATQIVLQITGPEGVERFMKAELSEMIG
jgi:hypothetical protein